LSSSGASGRVWIGPKSPILVIAVAARRGAGLAIDQGDRELTGDASHGLERNGTEPASKEDIAKISRWEDDEPEVGEPDSTDPWLLTSLGCVGRKPTCAVNIKPTLHGMMKKQPLTRMGNEALVPFGPSVGYAPTPQRSTLSLRANGYVGVGSCRRMGATSSWCETRDLFPSRRDQGKRWERSGG
jgi:hypothetical protein